MSNKQWRKMFTGHGNRPLSAGLRPALTEAAPLGLFDFL